MKQKINIKSLTVKSILIVVLCSIILMAIALPVVRGITFNIFSPYLRENIALKTGNCAVYMSMFLARSNPTMYYLTRYNDDFLTNVHNLARDVVSLDSFSSSIEKYTEPFTTEFAINDKRDFSAVSYPVIYIEGKGIFCNEKVSEAAIKLVSSEWFANYQLNLDEKYLYSPIIHQNTNGEQQYFSYVYSDYADSDKTERYYAILLTEFSEILPLWDDVLDIGIDDFGFIGIGNEILYQNLESSSWDLDWIQKDLASGRQHYVITHEAADKTYCASLVSYEREQLRFVMSFSNDIIANLFNDINLITQSILFIFVIALIFVIIIIFKHIFRRLTKLSEQMTVIQHGNYDVRLDDSSEDEIGQLATSFNIMTSKIQSNINELVEKEKREKMLQYNLTVSSIDPHFIYNTLNTSTRLAELGRPKDVVSVNDALINYLKDNLKMKNYQAFDTVANEINAIEQYITIQNYLCDNSIALQYSVTEENMQLRIPKFLLQPLVENSILHGILMNIGSDGSMITGKIKISIAQNVKRITIKIADNGIGMSPEAIQQYFHTDENVILNEKAYFEHIGILNLRSRLSYLYDNNYSIEAYSCSGKGTEIIIDIPVN